MTQNCNFILQPKTDKSRTVLFIAMEPLQPGLFTRDPPGLPTMNSASGHTGRRALG